MNSELKTYTGGCECGQVRYSVELDLQAGRLAPDERDPSDNHRSPALRGGSRNVPSVPSKRKYRGALVKPDAFKLLAGEAELCDFTFNSRSVVHHLFCRRCGIRSFCRGDIPEIGGAYVTVNLQCLDAVKYEHGRDNDAA